MDEVNKNMDSKGKNYFKNDEINLIEVGKAIWEGRKFALKIALVFCILGIIYALGTRDEFESNCRLLIESNDSNSSINGFSSLAGLAGINLNQDSKSSLNPELYPEITHSIPFLLNVVKEPIYFKNIDSTASSYQYFKEISKPSFNSYVIKYTIGLPALLKSLIINDKPEDFSETTTTGNLISINKQDSKFLKRFKDRIIVSVDIKTGIININCLMPDSFASAALADKCVSLLTKYIENYKINKYQKNLEFIQERLKEAEDKYLLTQSNLALFTDRNRNVITSRAKIEFQKLQNESNLAFDVYKGLASQLEQAKIKVKENTPVFTVLEPINIPIEKSSPKRKLIVVLFCITGFFMGLLYYFLMNIFKTKEN